MSLKLEIEKQISELLQNGIIKKSRSPYNSPLWIVPKKSTQGDEKKYRMVVDYRKLNKETIADAYPIPDINMMLMQLGSNNVFTVLDLKSGFHQIPLRPSDMKKTAFSINNGKYEFTRLPFGLKNAPAIFQRALDDILHEYIGRICHVYIDDIIIFSKSEDEHLQHINAIFETLMRSNMKVELEKCKFFQKQVEFLGYIISNEGIKADRKKVQGISEFPLPKTVRDVRAFLGLSGYYRRFIKNFALLTKPLTNLLRRIDGKIGKNLSKTTAVSLGPEEKKAFYKIKNYLISNEVILSYPDFHKEFHLTTDASNLAIGAVLEQGGRPISFISRSLSKAEEKYATNEKELLAIIWALNSLRNYLYGIAKVIIFTDHQPLTYALSDKNNNAKLKRWKAILEEYDYEIRYKPGKSNIVADTLSRPPQQINVLITENRSIPTVDAPINAFKNQIILVEGSVNDYKFEITFPTFHRHVITRQKFTNRELNNILKKYLNPSVINGIYTTNNIEKNIQESIHNFSSFKIRFTKNKVVDLANETDQTEQILNIHNRAHRGVAENKAQLIKKFYFPRLQRKIANVIKQCETCKINKYDRHPTKPEIQTTPIPEHVGQIIHIDLFISEKNTVLTAIDKFSKYARTKIVESRASDHIYNAIREIVFDFGVPQSIVLDNEKSFNSTLINELLQDQLRINIYRTPPYTSSSNGQVERFHSTLVEIMRCLKSRNSYNFRELLEQATYEYNCSVHSTIGKRPIDVFFNRDFTTSPEQFEQTRLSIVKKLKEKQDRDLKYGNKKKDEIKNYNVGEEIWVSINKRLGSKISPRYKKEVVAENRNTTILTQSGRIVHKSHIRH